VFQTLADATIPSITTFVDVAAAAMTTGIAGNGLLPGQVTALINWNQTWPVTVQNIDETSGGVDTETDDQYRYRIWLAIESFSTCGPHDAYEFWALSADPSIIQAVVYSAPDIAGEVWIYPLVKDAGGIPQPASTEICDKVLAICSAKDKRPVTDYVSVFPPTEFIYTLNVKWWLEEGQDVLLATIQTNVQAAVDAWILWERSFVSRDINGDELRKRMLEAGAKRVQIVSPSPDFQVMNYNQLAVHDPAVAPIVDYQGTEPP
jgi:phage-related baseplate assembly protein